jgi:hypothetical protein
MTALSTNGIVSGFYDVLTSKGQNPDKVLIDNMTKFAPSLSKLQWTKANNTVHHTYREVTNVTGVTDVYDFDSPIPNLSVSFSLNHTNLTPFAGAIEIGQDTATQMGKGVDTFFIEQAVLIARDLGMKLERSIFERIVRTAVDTNRRWMMFDDDLTEAAKNTLAIVTWEGGECCGLYSPAYGKVDSNKLFELEKFQNGALYQNAQRIPVYGCLFKVVLGLLFANKRMYSVVTNVDTEHANFAKIFPERMSEVMDDMLVGENTMILMSNRLKTKIGNQYTTNQSLNRLVQFNEKCNLSVCGVPVLHSANIPVRVDWSKIPSLPQQTNPSMVSTP